MNTDIILAEHTLRECPVFSALSEVDRSRVARLCEQKEYEVGAFVFQAGAPAGELLVLLEGRVALQMSMPSTINKGHRVTVDIVGRNEVIGWSAVVEPHVYTLTGVCIQPTKALSINGARLRSLLSANEHIGYLVLNQLIRVVASRLHDTRQVLASERL